MGECCFTNTFSEVPNLVCNKVCQGLKHVWQDHRVALFGTVSVIIAFKAHKAYKRNQLIKKWNSVGKDVVVLHGFSRGTTCSNISPFVIKVETYLRMAGLKYEFDSEEIMGPKTKTPWITINGEEIGDSELILDFLANKFNLNFSRNLTPEQNGASRSISVMADEHLFWGLVDWRCDKDKDKRILDLVDFPFYIKFIIRHGGFITEKMKAQGLGFHTAKEIEAIMIKDIESLSLFLGEKPFMMGDEPCEVDCSVFGIIAQFVWAAPGSLYASLLQSDYRNLMHYCFRMKEKFYPDWEQLKSK